MLVLVCGGILPTVGLAQQPSDQNQLGAAPVEHTKSLSIRVATKSVEEVFGGGGAQAGKHPVTYTYHPVSASSIEVLEKELRSLNLSTNPPAVDAELLSGQASPLP